MKMFGIIFLIVGMSIFFAGLVWFQLEYDHIMEGVIEAMIGPAVLLFVGFVFSSIGAAVFYHHISQRKKRDLLMRTGRKIQARVTEIVSNTSITVNGRHPYIVTCAANVSGKDLTFQSANIFASVLLNKGDELPVYIDFRDPGKYWVEVPETAVRK
ncbi:MAG TPA: hypothetical protein PKJ63_03255 [Cyclobacteriaceae bacterium]|nr:hypothetical protein [Cyclobacteriaceae bacterium]